MPLHISEAIILRTYKLGETDCIVVFLTRDRGKKRGVARRARQARSAFAGVLEPLTHVKVGYFERERRELVSLNYVDLVHSVMARSAAVEGYGYAEYFAELADEFAAENNPDERLFRLLAAVTTTLGATANLDAIARYVEYWILRLQGIYPPASACRTCGRELAGTGGGFAEHEKAFFCADCTSERRLMMQPAAFLFLATAARTAPAELASIELPAEANVELEAVHRNLITRHLEKELKSVRVLRMLKTGTGAEWRVPASGQGA